MKDIVLVGAGGFAREIAWLIEENNKENCEWNILGYIAQQEPQTIIGNYKVLGDDDWILNSTEQIAVVCCIADSHKRKEVIDLYENKTNLYFPTIISNKAIVSDHVSVGEGCIICAASVVTVDIKFGNFVICNLDCTIGHDAVLDDYVTLNPSVNISGNVHIEERVTVGTGANIIQGLVIGKDSTIGAGAVVVRDIPANCTAVGVPAKPIMTK
jgi:sugar O-acyltransferase (sialic acid O-acetyltransferase NeuD family)